MSLTLLGDVFLGVLLTLVADKVGRRKVLFGGSFLMILSGATFAIFENFWILLIAAVVGVVSVLGGDFGPFRAVEESILSQLTSPETRSDVLAWYVTTSTVGSAIGSELSGRLIKLLRASFGWELSTVYHALFWFYAFMGLFNAVLVLLLTKECELSPKEAEYVRVSQGEQREGSMELQEPQQSESTDYTDHVSAGSDKTSKTKRYWSGFSRRLAQISASTRATMYKLWLLLAMDSIADGMVPFPLTNYYIDQKFHPAKSTLGDMTSAAYFLGAISSVFAGPLARKIGLINTMVFTHIPSSAAVLLLPVPTSLWLTILLILIRSGLNNMDQAPRAAFIAAVVKPEERTAVMGITSMLRTLAAMTGPSLTGLLAGNDRFWIAFVAAGALRLAYDVGLYVLFVNMKLYQHEGGGGGDGGAAAQVLERRRAAAVADEEEEDFTELEDLMSEVASSRSSEDGRSKGFLSDGRKVDVG